MRVPDAPGFSVSADNGVFTTLLPHAEVTQVMARPAGTNSWTMIDVAPGSYEAVLPEKSRPEPGVSALPASEPPAGASPPRKPRKA